MSTCNMCCSILQHVLSNSLLFFAAGGGKWWRKTEEEEEINIWTTDWTTTDCHSVILIPFSLLDFLFGSGSGQASWATQTINQHFPFANNEFSFNLNHASPINIQLSFIYTGKWTVWPEVHWWWEAPLHAYLI